MTITLYEIRTSLQRDALKDALRWCEENFGMEGYHIPQTDGSIVRTGNWYAVRGDMGGRFIFYRDNDATLFRMFYDSSILDSQKRSFEDAA
ncbi:hypothetical protein [Microvirga pudoricolor]|uniref:hypothetical protein n=1 Tax=Microvirga pudoricolor TaxID=2778729 RepID=UPI0019519090|nr:hypothetical protein [Microvirga pudoricolor]MBM6595572.1 hypothetical protein [Microvirga pudoricolor]